MASMCAGRVSHLSNAETILSVPFCSTGGKTGGRRGESRGRS